MAKKSHADIMEKLSALKPSEPTKTRGTAGRKPAVKKAAVKKAAAAKRPAKKAAPGPQVPPETQAAPAPQAPPAASVKVFSYPLFGPLGDAGRMYIEVCEHCCRLVTDANRTVANFNSLFVNSITYLANPGRWWRF